MRKSLKMAALGLFLSISIISCKKDDPTDPNNGGGINHTKFSTTSFDIFSYATGADVSSLEDLYIKVYDGANLLYTSGYVKDTYEYTFNKSMNLERHTNYIIEIWDFDDLSADDYLGNINITPNNYHPSKPSDFNDDLSITINGTWQE